MFYEFVFVRTINNYTTKSENFNNYIYRNGMLISVKYYTKEFAVSMMLAIRLSSNFSKPVILIFCPVSETNHVAAAANLPIS